MHPSLQLINASRLSREGGIQETSKEESKEAEDKPLFIVNYPRSYSRANKAEGLAPRKTSFQTSIHES